MIEAAASQSWNPDRYRRNAAFVADMAAGVVELLAPKAGERILDLGCGDGVLSEKLQRAGVEIVAVDASAAQVEGALRRGLDARVADGEALKFEGEFDAVFSNAALHWMSRNPDAVIAGVWRALKPGGRFVAEMGGAGNVDRIAAALEAALDRRGCSGADTNPWYFPTAEEYAGRLAHRGFRVDTIALIPRPTPLPGDFADWIETFGEAFAGILPAAERPAYVAEVTEALAPALKDSSGVWIADYVRLRFAAHKPHS